LEKHAWKGNVRELVNLCERAVLLAQNKQQILPEDLPESFAGDATLRVVSQVNQLRVEIPDGVSFDDLERAILERALERSDGNVSRAAASLRMGRGQFRYRMARLGMTIERPQRMRRQRLAS
jgi:two-component system NtrC family response regulator